MLLGKVGFEGEKQMKLEQSLRVVEESMVAEAIVEYFWLVFGMFIGWKMEVSAKG